MKAGQEEELIDTLKSRFEGNMQRHPGLDWDAVQAKIEANPEKLWSLAQMEHTGGEPDVVGFDAQSGEFIFADCSAESPSGRRSMTAPGWNPERSTGRRAPRRTWPKPWESRS